MSLEKEAPAAGAPVPRIVVAPGGDVDALEHAIALCCVAGVLQLPPGGVLLVPEPLQPDGLQRGRLVTWEVTEQERHS